MTVSKKCSACGIEQSVSGFYKEFRAADGLRSDCKICVRKRDAAWFNRNRGKVLHRVQNYNKQRYLEHRDEILAQNRAWSKSHPESAQKRTLAWRARNLERARASDRRKAKLNPGPMAAKTMRRHAAKLKAMPFWLTAEDHELMRFLYKEAAQMSKDFGVKFHVDHIVPLRGKTVCGLHVPWNLQVIAASRNLSKNNRLEVA